MQGDVHRAKQKDRERLREKPDYTRILSGVDDMRINDADNRDKYDEYSKQIEFDDNGEVSDFYLYFLSMLKHDWPNPLYY